MINTLIWNARGALNSETADYIKSLVSTHQPDICVIIDPLKDGSFLAAFANRNGFPNCFWAAGTNEKIWIMWSSNITLHVVDSSSQAILVKTFIDNKVVYFTFVYASCSDLERRTLWDFIIDSSSSIEDPWLVMGDFNAITSWAEKKGGNQDNSRSMVDFCEFHIQAGLGDAGFIGNPFTWSNDRSGDDCIWERLDRVLLNSRGFVDFPALEVHHLTRRCSDHCPLLVRFEPTVPRKSPFRFMRMWTDHPEFLDFVLANWPGSLHQNPLINFGLKLKHLKFKLKKWNWEVFGDFRISIRDLESKINSLEEAIQLQSSHQLEEELSSAKKDLALHMRSHYKTLEDQSHVRWLAEGDRNTQFFHAVIKARKARNRFNLLQEDGSYTTDRDIIGQGAARMFEDLFGAFSPVVEPGFFDFIDPIVSEEENAALTDDPSLEEIWSTINSMQPYSAPGPDGFTVHFFIHCWSIIKDDLFDAIRLFFRGLSLPKLISSNALVLLPKINNASSLSQLRPISLCNVVHKIISKILNDRLLKVLPSIISPEQGGFLPNRSIHESIALAHELVSDLHCDVRGGNTMLKIDMSKAFDRVSWHFILGAFKAFGFNNTWCDLIYRNMSNCWYTIRWDGKDFGKFKSNKGVRQGDPLSPSLFILTMELLSRMLARGVQFGAFLPYTTKPATRCVTHLLYADDMLLFSNGARDSLRGILGIVHDFCEASGQLLNSNKSHIFLSKRINANRKRLILSETNFQEGTLPTSYLGAPLYCGPSNISYFNELETKVKNRVQGWMANLLSMGSKTALLNSVLASMPIHTLSALPVPKGVLVNISRHFAGFLWDAGGDKRRHWISWERVCLPKDAGGLGCRSLCQVMASLHGKFAWKFLQGSSLWADFMRQKYDRNPHLRSSSGFWKAIRPHIALIREQSYWILGKGDIPLERFVDSFQMAPPAELKSLPMSSFVNSPQLRYQLHCALPQLDISNIRLSGDADRLIWQHAELGNFSPKAYWSILQPQQPISVIHKKIWQSWIPPKISCFVWRLISKAIPTDDRVARFGIQLASRCLCCPQPCQESIQHLFVDSHQAQRVWQHFGTIFNKPHPTSIPHLLDSWITNSSTSSQIGCLAILASCCSLWELWCFRNAARHEKHQQDIIFLTKRWIMSLNNLIHPSLTPSPQDISTAALLHVQLVTPPPSQGSWLIWHPHGHGLTLSFASKKLGGGYIFRSSSGAVIFAASIKLPDFDEVGAQLFILLLGLMLAKRRHYVMGIIQSHSHSFVGILNGQRQCPWKWTYLKRWVLELLGDTLVSFLPKNLNRPARSLAAGASNRSFTAIEDFPEKVRIFVEADRQRCPIFCKGLVHYSPNPPS